MAGYLRVKNFWEYQHYKDRNPPWVKLYTKLAEPDDKLNDLPVPTRYLFDRMLLLAARYDNAIPNDHELLARLLRMRTQTVREGVEQLVKRQYLSQTRTKRRASKAASNGAS